METIEIIKKLREETGMGIMDIKEALREADNDLGKAMELLKARGAEIMAKKAERQTQEGLIETYNHQDRIGVILEVNCETDFVTKNPDFKTFVHDLALQISSMNPSNTEELLAQEFIKDPSQIIADLLQNLTAKLGEKIVVKRFVRFQLGETDN